MKRVLQGVFIAAFIAASLLTGGAANAASALINGSTVSGSPSQEEMIATAAGFTVTVVSDAVWATMTANDFDDYDLLIAGDPFCGTLPPGLVATAPIYGAVVLGNAGTRTQPGRRVVAGIDVVLHDGGDYTSPGARGTILRESIVYAGGLPGRTGMYFCTTCAANYFGQSAETLAILEEISSELVPAWTIDNNPPCGGSVSLITADPNFTDTTTASLQGWGCSVHESFPTYSTDFFPLAVATDTASHPTCGVDPNTGLNACGEAYILITSGVVISQGISLNPPEATNPVGTAHKVIANVHEEDGTPLVGVLVTFTVLGQNAGAAGVCIPADCRSDANGDVSFTYVDTNGAGDDTIKASFTDAAGSLQTATAIKHWEGNPCVPPDCNDNNPCTDDRCDPVLGCVYVNNTAPCDDGNPCTSDICSGGSCVGTATDSDGDGVPDCDDGCPHSCLDPTVIIPPTCLTPPPPGTAPNTSVPCDSGVPNYPLPPSTAYPPGCTIEDAIAHCDAISANKSQFDKCVKALLSQLKKQGVITEAQRKAIDKCVKKYKKRSVRAHTGSAGSSVGAGDH